MGYNNGDTYEENIYNCCNDLNILPPNFSRAGAAADKPDVMFVHQGKEFKLEVKDFTNPDYGQRRIHFYPDRNKWEWARQDKLSELYEELNLKEQISHQFNPIWYQKRVINNNGRYQNEVGMEYNLEDLKSDQQLFGKDKILIPRKTLFLYYSLRDTHYIQIHRSGLYHLDEDVANLGTPQFDGDPHFRFRVKRTSSKLAPHACQFLGVMKLEKKNYPTKSKYNLDKADLITDQLIPDINP